MPRGLVALTRMKKKEPLRTHQHKIMHPTNTLERALVFLTYMVDEHIFIKLVSLGEKVNPC